MVVKRLTDWFQHKELEELLGDLAYTVRQSRVARGEQDRRGTKTELATALVVQHGIDLLANGGAFDKAISACREVARRLRSGTREVRGAAVRPGAWASA